MNCSFTLQFIVNATALKSNVISKQLVDVYAEAVISAYGIINDLIKSHSTPMTL